MSKSAATTILVLEDEPLVMAVLQHVLEWRGFVVLQAASAAEAVEQFRCHQQTVDLLIADLAIPDGSGVAVALEFSRISTKVRILLTSGSPPMAWSDRDRENFSLLPARRVGFLQKPFSPGVLLGRVADLMEAPAGMTASA